MPPSRLPITQTTCLNGLLIKRLNGYTIRCSKSNMGTCERLPFLNGYPKRNRGPVWPKADGVSRELLLFGVPKRCESCEIPVRDFLEAGCGDEDADVVEHSDEITGEVLGAGIEQKCQILSINQGPLKSFDLY